MRGLLLTLQSGDLLTRERVRLWALAVLVASVAGVAFLWITSNGLDDFQGKPLGTDFSNIYAGGTYVLDGKPELAFDPLLQHARREGDLRCPYAVLRMVLSAIFIFCRRRLGADALPAGAVRLAGHDLSALSLLAIWTILSCPAAYAPPTASELGEADRVANQLLHAPPTPRSAEPPSPFRRDLDLALLLAVSFPAVFVNLGHGHNGFLTAALMGFALVLLDRRPVVAGILFGLLAYKPQFGLLIPLVLIATDRWKTFAAAAATVGVLALAATLAFGPQVWPAFFASTAFTREVVLEAGGTGWHKIQTVFSWVRMWGGPISLAYTVQILVTLALSIGVVWLWRSGTSMAVKAAGLIIASLLATPYSLDYDLMALAPAIAFWASEGISGIPQLGKNHPCRNVDCAPDRPQFRGGYVNTTDRSAAPCCFRAAAAPRRRGHERPDALAFPARTIR